MDASQKCYVAYLDVMGFAQFVENNTADTALKYLRDLTTVNSVFDAITPDVSSKFFSDTIALFVLVEDDVKTDLARYMGFLRYVGMLQYQSITAPNLMGLPLRGAITKGDFYSDDNGIIVGKAWVEAVKLESKASVPRVIVKKEAHDYNIVLTMTVDKSANYRAAPLRLDSDGELHCNYLNNVLDVDGYPAKNLTFILQHQKAVVNNLKITEGCRKTNDYYKWVMAYHNWFCTGYDELRQFIIPEDVCTMEVV